MEAEKEYVLGVNPIELDRLGFQHGVWKKVTDNFFDRIGVGEGWKCLDVGAGPGFVSMDLRKRVGESGEVAALEPAKYYLEHFETEAAARGWENITLINGTAETATLPTEHFDLIFVRWVIGFVPDPEKFILNLLPSLKKGGVIAIQDYLYSGLGLYPKGGAFDGALEMVIKHWAASGGDAFVAAKIPAIFRKHGVELIGYSPNCLAGGPDSDVIEWADRFFTKHMHLMVETGATTKEMGEAMLKDWNEHRKNPDTIFCSPIVVDMAGRKC
ncbi:MAG: class I SAM-dependent methyltransferase [Ignavibacteriota bacterium]